MTTSTNPTSTDDAVSLVDTFAPFAPKVTGAAEVVLKAEGKLTALRMTLGSIVGKASAALLAVGATTDEVKDIISSALIVESVGTLEWTTVQGWVRSARVESTLPKDVRESLAAAGVGVDGFAAIGSVPDKDGAREAFAREVIASGASSIRDIRESAKLHKPAKDKPKQNNAAKVADVVKASGTLAGKSGWNRDDASAVETALHFIGLRDKCPGFSMTVMRSACEEILHPTDAS